MSSPLDNSPANRKHHPLKMSSPTKRIACIEDLPWEIISELFKHLNPEDLVVCSMVNKRWHSIHAAFKLHTLAVTEFDPTRDLCKWHHSNQPIQEAERCGLPMFHRFAEKPLLSNLRKLAVSGKRSEFDLNKLNRFRQLVHLEINTPLDEKLDLNLPRLRVLAFHYFNDGCDLSIDCPELSTLFYYNHAKFENLLDVKYPETIRVLKTNMVDQQLAPFKNVDCLVTREFKVISEATLLSLPRLRELRYDRDLYGLVEDEFRNQGGAVNEMKRTLSEFVDEAKKLRGRDFRFTFAGFQLTNVDIHQIDFGEQDHFDEYDWVRNDGFDWVRNEYVYMKNYHLIEPGALHFVHRVNYNRLLDYVTEEFLRCFSQKFTRIEIVQVDGLVKDAGHLLWFLKSLRFLKRLELGAELSQEFYEQLPALAPSLVSLKFQEERNEMKELHLNFDFIRQFPHLSDLAIFPALSLSSTTSLVRWLGGLKEVSIYVQSEGDLWIKKERDSPLWKVKDSENTPDSLFETENPGELGIFFAGFRAALLKAGKASD